MSVEKWVSNDKVAHDTHGDPGLSHEMIINDLAYFKGTASNHLPELVKSLSRFRDLVNVISHWSASAQHGAMWTLRRGNSIAVGVTFIAERRFAM